MVKCVKFGCNRKPVFEGKACELHMCQCCDGKGFNEPLYQVKVPCDECKGTGLKKVVSNVSGWSR
jgi:DnaJ-class molecular chaperone